MMRYRDVRRLRHTYVADFTIRKCFVSVLPELTQTNLIYGKII